jgi:hypothetical protein
VGNKLISAIDKPGIAGGIEIDNVLQGNYNPSKKIK